MANSIRHRELSVWGQAKQLLRQLHQRCRSFKFTKKLFELFIKHRLFTLPNLNSYDAFSLDFGQNQKEFAIDVCEQVVEEGTSLMRRLIAVSPN